MTVTCCMLVLSIDYSKHTAVNSVATEMHNSKSEDVNSSKNIQDVI